MVDDPPLHCPPQADGARQVQEHGGVARGQAAVQRAGVVAVHHPGVAGEQFVQRDLLDAHVHRALGAEERIEGDDLHPEAQRAVGDDGADIARADHADAFSTQLPASAMGR